MYINYLSHTHVQECVRLELQTYMTELHAQRDDEGRGGPTTRVFITIVALYHLLYAARISLERTFSQLCDLLSGSGCMVRRSVLRYLLTEVVVSRIIHTHLFDCSHRQSIR